MQKTKHSSGLRRKKGVEGKVFSVYKSFPIFSLLAFVPFIMPITMYNFLMDGFVFVFDLEYEHPLECKLHDGRREDLLPYFPYLSALVLGLVGA